MALPGDLYQFVELVQQFRRRPLAIDQPFALRPPDFSLSRILVKRTKEGVEARRQIELMKSVNYFRLTERRRDCHPMQGSYLQVAPPSLARFLLEGLRQDFQFFVAGDEWFAVIREWQRNQSSSRQPAFHSAKYQRVLQIMTRWRCRVGDGFVSITARQRGQPSPRVKHRGMRMSFHEFIPTRIQKWLEAMRYFRNFR